jgi:hypothetical protein
MKKEESRTLISGAERRKSLIIRAYGRGKRGEGLKSRRYGVGIGSYGIETGRYRCETRSYGCETWSYWFGLRLYGVRIGWRGAWAGWYGLETRRGGGLIWVNAMRAGTACAACSRFVLIVLRFTVMFLPNVPTSEPDCL